MNSINNLIANLEPEAYCVAKHSFGEHSTTSLSDLSVFSFEKLFGGGAMVFLKFSENKFKFRSKCTSLFFTLKASEGTSFVEAGDLVLLVSKNIIFTRHD